jgi:carbon monoxide dehydrogenase subunit G
LWDVLDDVGRIAPYVPGFELQESISEDRYTGAMLVKVGAITLHYSADVEIKERVAAEHRVVFAIKGRERRGPGAVSANVTSVLKPTGDVTQLELVADLRVSGRVAQFGGAVLSEVSAALLAEFVRNLESGEFAGERHRDRVPAKDTDEDVPQDRLDMRASSRVAGITAAQSAPREPVPTVPLDLTSLAGHSVRRFARHLAIVILAAGAGAFVMRHRGRR